MDGGGEIDFDVSTVSCTDLPTIDVPATINGAATGDVTISGSGLALTAGNSVVEYLVINGGSSIGVLLQGANNQVLGNQIEGNGTWGVILDQAPSNVVGGTTAVSRNVISGNQEGGLAVIGGSSTADLVEGNYIGTDSTGTVAMGNAYGGVYVGSGSMFTINGSSPQGSASGASIGGSTAGAGNLISGNDTALTGNGGIVINGTGASNNLLDGNLIGVNASGSAALVNQGVGIDIFGGATGNTVGGSTAAAANVVSGNSGAGANGINITGPGTADNLVQGNLVGVDITGKTAIANGGSGIFITSASGNTVGGSAAGVGNVVSGNTGSGIALFGSGTTGNLVEGNYVGTNATGTAAIANVSVGVIVFDGASGNTIGGSTSGARNLISGNQSQGVLVFDGGTATTGNVIEGNLIGTDVTGTSAIGNTGQGINVGDGASSNTIGGTISGARNVVSGNNGDGIAIDNSGTSQNVVEGNYIGTDINGSVALGNTGVGVSISDSASNSTIGGTTSAAANIISGNANDGIDIDGSGTSANVVAGNLVGTDVTGTQPVGNGADGLQIYSGATGTTVGGTAQGSGNVISSNASSGIEIQGVGTQGTVIQGNWVGTDSSGTADLGNGVYGIEVDNGATQSIIGRMPDDISPPGTPDQPDPAANVIAFNGTAIPNGAGVVIVGDNTTGNDIRANSIFANGPTPGPADGYSYNSGIDLGGDGRTLNTNPQNTSGTGPNGWQNFPISSLVKQDGGDVEIIGTIKSLPDTSFTLDYYADPSTSLQDIRQGKDYIGSTVVETNDTGLAPFDVTLAQSMDAGGGISATATGPYGTSEFEFMYTRPILIVPGIVGSMPTSADFSDWLVQRGFDPRDLVADPLAGTYNDVIQTLINIGYVQGQTLFVANYDWRIEPAPLDLTSYNGTIPGLSGASIASDIAAEQYNNGVDYLGFWLEQAAEAFNDQYPDVPLDSVDVIAHSTGGLITCAYIQSGAYGDTVPWNIATTKLPKINNFIMEGVPNLGAPTAFNVLKDNWISDSTGAFQFVFSKIILMAYQKLLAGQTITGPQPGDDITLKDVTNSDGTLNYQALIGLYVPTLYGLMTTQPFLNLGNGQGLVDVNNNPAFSNTLLLDLNGGDGLSSFEMLVQQVTDIYGNGVPTVVSTNQMVGPISPIPIVNATLFPFTSYIPVAPLPNETWYQDQKANTGDGTVPVASSATPFVGNPNVTLYQLQGVSHGELPSNRNSQMDVLQTLGVNTSSGVTISTGLSTNPVFQGATWRILFTVDPVGALLTNAEGQQVGYAPTTGAVEQIPDSVYWGNGTAGFGLAFGTGPAPTQFQLTGMGGSYTVLVSGQDGAAFFGTTASGTLASEQTQSLSLFVTLAAPGTPTIVPSDDSGIQGDGVTDDPTPSLTGTTFPGATVRLLDPDDDIVATATANSAGVYVIPTPGPLAVGAYTYRVQTLDQYGDVSTPSAGIALGIVAVPATPGAPTLLPADSNGALGVKRPICQAPT